MPILQDILQFEEPGRNRSISGSKNNPVTKEKAPYISNETAKNVIINAAKNGSISSSPSSAYGAMNMQNMSNDQSYLELLKQISDSNNQYNLEQVKMVNDFNALEAAKNRDWQEQLSNTAHQREVKDLIAAGLNPVLSAGGQGAVVGSGAVASGQKAVADNIFGQGVMNLMTATINAASAQKVAQINAAAKIGSSHVSASAQRYYADTIASNAGVNAIAGLARSFISSVPGLMREMR